MKWQTKGITIMRPMGLPLLCIPLPRDEEVGNIKEEEVYTVEIKQKRKHRSLDANAYCWVLCQKIAEMLSKDGQYISKEEIYRTAIKSSQRAEIVAVPSDMVERFISKWQSNGIGWRVDVEDSRIDGTKKCYLYAGSSTYNTKEMSRLIECLVDECHQLGIRLEDRAYIK